MPPPPSALCPLSPPFRGEGGGGNGFVGGVQKLSAYDEDAELSVSTLLELKTCNGRIGATGMCLGGHLAYRCALDARVAAAVCYFATDIHSRSLGLGVKDDSLARAGDVRGELVLVSFFFFLSLGDVVRLGGWVGARAWRGKSECYKLIFGGQIFGKKDNHVPPEGRDLIRKTLHEKGVVFSFYEVAQAQRRFCSVLYAFEK